jgi:hypothetical protein
LLKKVAARDLFGGRLAEFGVHEAVNKDTTETSRCLTDGRNYLPVRIDEDGFVTTVTRHWGNAPGKILNALAEAFETDIVSEYEPQYWGFKTEEEWDAWQRKLGKEDEDAFYADFLKYLRGEPHPRIIPGRIGMYWAEIGKTLVEKDPSLLLPENKDKLLADMESVYRRGDYTVKVTLTPQEIASAEMIATHQDDLPKA